ncbi:cytochrome c [Bosea sp. R86505]|uniref:cytochrome c n=1 Tax=Bosea sp. R86505 TaxID=3101710 RepID=UPI00366B7EA3
MTGSKAHGFLRFVWSRRAAPGPRSWRIGHPAALAFAIMTSMSIAHHCHAQALGPAQTGRALAESLCTACHRIGAYDRDSSRMPPDFGAVAAMPSMTETSLRVFLRTPHGEMPRYQFSTSEMDDLIAYLQSLR